MENRKQIRYNYSQQLIGTFERYYTEKVKQAIRTPIHTCKVLARLGLLNPELIDHEEKGLNIMTDAPRTKNEELIYSVLDGLIGRNEHLIAYMQTFIHEFDNCPDIVAEEAPFTHGTQQEMPFNNTAGIEPNTEGMPF